MDRLTIDQSKLLILLLSTLKVKKLLLSKALDRGRNIVLHKAIFGQEVHFGKGPLAWRKLPRSHSVLLKMGRDC